MEMFLKREGFSEKFPLSSNQNRYILGRNPTCDIKFTSPFISRQHCEIKRVPPHGTLMIRNLKATNVTYVDELELRDLEMIAELRPGCQIGLGVPLNHATDEGIRNSQYVFLRLCEPEEQNETRGNMSSLNETVNFSPGQIGRRLSNSRPPGDTVPQTEKSEDAGKNASRTGTPQEGGIMSGTSATSFDPQAINVPKKTSYSHSGSGNDYVMPKLQPNSSDGFIPCIEPPTSATCTRPSLAAAANVPQSSGTTKPPALCVAQPEVSCSSNNVRSLPLLTRISSVKRKESLELFDNMDLKVQVNVDIPDQSEISNQDKHAASTGDEMRKSSHSISGLPLHAEETKQGPSSLSSEGQYSAPVVQSLETHRRQRQGSGAHSVSHIQQDSSMRSEGDACSRASPSFPVQHVHEIPDGISGSKPFSSSKEVSAKVSAENLGKSIVEDRATVMGSSSFYLNGKGASGFENQTPFQDQHVETKQLLQNVNNIKVQTPVLGPFETSCIKPTKEQTNSMEKTNEFDTYKDKKGEPKDCGQTDLITIDDEFSEGDDIIDLTQQDPVPDSSIEKKTKDGEQDLMACFVASLKEEEKGETANEGSAKRKRNTGEETVKSQSSTSVGFKDVKKARLSAPAVSNSNLMEDSESDSDSGVLKIQRNCKLKRRIVVSSDSETEMEKSKSLNEQTQQKEQFRIKTEINAWAKRNCQVAIEKLPSSLVEGAVSGKEIIDDKKIGLTVHIPPKDSRNRILTSRENKTSENTSNKVSSMGRKQNSKIDLPCNRFGLDDDDDDLPDLNNEDFKPIRGSVSSENVLVRRRSTEDDDKRKGKDPPKACRNGKGSFDSQCSDPPVKHHIGKKEPEPPSKRHKRQNSRDSQPSDAQETRDSQKVSRTDKNPKSASEVSLFKAGRNYKNSGESSDEASSKGATKCAVETSASVLSVAGSSLTNEDDDYIFCKPRPDTLVKIKKEVVQENVVNMKIKTEKIDKDQWHLNIKREPEEKGKECTEKKKFHDTGDDDDVLIMYSQVDEPIWLSSDEEDSTTSVNADVSFGPLPPSPELGIEELFATEDQQKEAETVDKAKGSAVTEIDIDEDDQWFPVLSQSFWDDDTEEIKKSSKMDEPVPGPSSTSSCAKQSDELEDDDKWLELSQGFMDDDADFEDKSSKDKDVTDSSLKYRSVTVEKSKNKDPRKSQLIDPKMPPARTKSDSLRKRGLGTSDTASWSSKRRGQEKAPDTDHRRLEESAEKHTKARTTKIITPPQKSYKKKGSSLRDNLAAKYNLQSYKSTVEQKKENHHLVPRPEDDKKKESSHRKSHLVTSEPRKEENISVQKKPSYKEGGDQAKSRSTVAAKVTSKNRSDKLIDINIFPSPEVPKPQLRKKYKIPKNDATKKADSSNDKKEGSSNVLDASTKRTPPAPEINTLENIERETRSTPTQKDSEKVTVTGDAKASSIMKDTEKGNVKAKKRVHFPSRLEDLEKVLYISPRKNAERLGALSVKAKEVLPKELLFLKYKIPNNYFDQFIYFVCRWNYDWLESYRVMQEKHANGKLKEVRPPPIVQNTTYPTLILYDSYNDYKEIFSTLMYYEVWEHVYQDWLQYRNTNMWLTAQIDVIQPLAVDREVNAPKFWVVKVITLITQEQSNRNYHPRQGSLVALKLHEGKRRVVILGYVDNIIKSRKRNVTKELDKMVPQGEVCLLLCMRVTKDTIQTVQLGKMIYVSNVSYIRPATRTWEGLCKLPQSPLCGDILKPSEEVFKCSQHPGEYIIHDMPLNSVQKKAVVEVGSKCTVDELVPKISLIHGPPGTGKTRTITALIAQITKSSRENKKPCRILLCAPSNAAVDELTLRLIKLKEIGLSLRLVRVGVKESISTELREYTLDSFVQRQVKIELSTPKNVSTRQEWERKRYMVKQAADALEKARKENRSKDEIKAMETRLNELVRGKTEFERSFHSQPNSQERFKLQQKWQEQFLLGAEVITVTLGGCVSGVMQEVLGKLPHAFTCCIIDEAGQCKETETWLPLLYGVRKLVLVGDHKQLPATVISQLAQNKNLKQSLFERFFYRYVIELQMDNVIHSLNVQYRMHPEIADWPCKHFYLNKLVTSPEIVMERTYGLRPYIVFDLKTSQEQKNQNNEFYNPAEASLIRILLEAIEPDIAQQKVAIITPYQCQKYKLEEKLAKFFGRINLVINTIDAFQGQERDVVILSFVRANPEANIGFLSQRQRLNVALTRARRSCYIVASLSSLAKNDDWKSLIQNAHDRNVVKTITQAEENDRAHIRKLVQK
nr:uncharacterized protein LOC113816670 [Penaeus vannamei]